MSFIHKNTKFTQHLIADNQNKRKFFNFFPEKIWSIQITILDLQCISFVAQ